MVRAVCATLRVANPAWQRLPALDGFLKLSAAGRAGLPGFTLHPVPASTPLAALGGLRAEFQDVFPGPPLAQVAPHAGFTSVLPAALSLRDLHDDSTALLGHKGKCSTRRRARFAVR